MARREELWLGVWLVATATAIVAAWQVSSPVWKTVFDNLQWTSAFAGSAWLAWRGVVVGEAQDRALRRGLFVGAALILAGQLVWNLQVMVSWRAFPAPADALFLLAAPAWIAGWLVHLVRALPRERIYPSFLDISGAVCALLAATLALYVPFGAEVSVAGLLVLVLYPVTFLSAASLALLVVPTMGLRAGFAHWLMLAGMVVYGLGWMQWNLLSMADALMPGSLFNASFSLAAVLLGLGARHLRVERAVDARYQRVCERIMTFVPLVAMTLAMLTLVVLFWSLEDDGVAHRLIFVCCLMALLFSALRQTMVIGLLDRLRRAESAILHNEEQMYRLAHFDALTNLPNRRLFEDRLEHALRDAQARQGRVAVLLVDLDHFKHINDIFGHRAGDRLICETAARLEACMGGGASLARMGGDEFMVMVERCRSRTDVAALALTMLDALRQPWDEAEVGQHIVGASIGISVYPDDAGDVVDLVRNADSALNEAKSAGRGTYRFYLEAFTEFTRRRLALRSRLHRALAHAELFLAYQPQYNAERELVGLEVLLRWTLDGAPVSPDEFIPVAEESGLIVPIGAWVFESACLQAARWRADGRRVPTISVNLSARQLAVPDLARQLADMAQAAGVLPADFTLEVTESQLLDDGVLPTVKALRRAGFRLSMDDFGTGHSSLIKLKTLPVGELKIDKAFVRDIADDDGDREICATIHALAATLGMDVVAEGVETEAQFQLLVDMGCRRFQGWLFAAAMPASLVPLARLDEETPG